MSYPSLLFEFPFQEFIKAWVTIRTETEQGYVQTRAKTTSAPRVYGANAHRNVSSANVDDFLTHWNAVKGGADSFAITDPRSGGSITVRFTAQPTIRRTGPQTWDIENLVFEEAL